MNWVAAIALGLLIGVEVSLAVWMAVKAYIND